MKSKNSSSNSFGEYLNMNISRETVVKLILQNLIDRYSLKNVINDIMKITKQKENQLVLKDKIPLNSEDIISIIYKNVGSIKLYQCLLDISETTPEITTSSKKKTIKTEKFNNFSKFKNPLSTKEEQKLLNIGNNINKSNEKNNNDFVKIGDIEISPNKFRNNNTISSNETETTVYEIKNGGKTELKRERKREKKILEKKRNRQGKSTSVHMNGIYSESKLINMPNKLGKAYENKLGFHYVLEKGNLYKFKVKEVDNEKEKAKFICDDPKCQGTAEYTINNKMFKSLKEHSISHDEHCYNKYMVFTDMNILNYMLKHKIEDLQLTRI